MINEEIVTLDVENRKKKVFNFIKNGQLWVVLVLILALILGVYTRVLPMVDHDSGTIPSIFQFVFTPSDIFNGKPGLWDITTNNWALGPDLDPWLFLRYADIIVEKGSLPTIDYMRNVPLGFPTINERGLLPYMIAWNYQIFHSINSKLNIEFGGVVFPVVMFFFTIISFFLFVREVFIRKDKESQTKANIISLISTFLMIVIPTFLSRTIAGIPEKESAAFFFMFLTFYLFLKSWKSEKMIWIVIFGAFAGISTGMMSMIWGGDSYVFITIAVSSLLAFMINKIHRKEFITYSSWFFVAMLFMLSNKPSIKGILSSLDTGLSFLVFFICVVHFIVIKMKIGDKILKNKKIPPTILSLIISIILIGIIGSILFGPNFIIDKVKVIHQTIFQPVTGRWSTTVAENRQPDFKEWSQSFGPFIKNIPILFWLFFIGSVLLFRKTLGCIKKKDALYLTGFYLLFLIGIIFSRYSSSSIFNGDNLISKLFYYISALLLIFFLGYYYFKYNKEGDKSFENIDNEYLLLFALFILTIFTARGAVRLIMVLAPIAPIFVGFLIVDVYDRLKKSKDETMKIFLGIVLIIVLLSSLFSFWAFYNQIKSESYGFVPGIYNQQWQKSMEWVRQNTSESAVFAHWSDYGYWVQSIGNRSTVLDGGNAIAFWNYYMGRLVLTGDNQKDALDFLYSHDANYLLIDSTDIGKYGAFSSIGSDKNYDRYSWIGTYLLDDAQTQETNNQTVYAYVGGVALDEDITVNDNGKTILFPGQKAGAYAIILPLEKIENETRIDQPSIILVYQNKQQKVMMRYASVNGKFIDFGSGIEACAYIFPKIEADSSGRVVQNPIGAAMFLSPRLLKGFLAQKYILDDPFNKFPNFKVVHSEPSIIIDNLNSQGMNLPEFVYYQGIQGPIKIWKIKYTGNEKVQQKYLDTDPSKYLSWQL